MPKLVEDLFREISAIPTIDIHSHVRQLTPSASSLRDLLGYHYYTELTFSSGTPKEHIAPNVPDEEMLPALIAAMDRFSNTVQYEWAVELSRKLFGFRGRRLTADNWPALEKTAAKKLASKGWMAEVMKRANIDKVFLTNSFTEDLSGFDTNVLVPCLRCDDLVFKFTDAAVRDNLARKSGVAIADTKSLRRAVAAVFDYFAAHQAKCAAISLPPDFVCRPVTDAQAEPILAAALKGSDLPAADRAALSAYLFYLLAENCQDRRLPMQLMIGVLRSIYAHGVYQGTDVVSNQGSLAQYADLFNRFPGVVFTVSYLSPTMAHELLTYTWIFQNVRASGHWWYTNIPGYIEPDLRCRIEALPRTKLIGYYSDAYYIEFTLPKFAMYRWCLARVLAEQVTMKRLTEEESLTVARCLLRDNAMEIFHL
jgi:glucuronate isomerase